MFLGRTLYSHSTSLHPGVQVGTGEFIAGVYPVMSQHPIPGANGKTFNRFMLQTDPRGKRRSDGPLARMQTLPKNILNG